MWKVVEEKESGRVTVAVEQDAHGRWFEAVLVVRTRSAPPGPLAQYLERLRLA